MDPDENKDTMENRTRYWENMNLQPFFSERAPAGPRSCEQRELADRIEDCCDRNGLYLHAMASNHTKDHWFARVASVPDGDRPQEWIQVQGTADEVVTQIDEWAVLGGRARPDSMWTEYAKRLRMGYRGYN